MRKVLLAILAGLMTVLLVCIPLTATPLVVRTGSDNQLADSLDLPVRKLTASMSTSLQELNVISKPLARKPPPATASNKWAVIIGIADYTGSDSDLWHPDEDANEMAKALINNYGFASERVKILLNRKATASAILAAISWLVLNEDAASTVVFFYSGHGFRAADSDGWDSDNESDGFDEGIVSYDFYGLPDSRLQQQLAGLESQKVALLFGSCHSGGLLDNNELQGVGRVVATACKADQYGWDYLTLGNTLWGKYFVDDSLLLKKADLNGNGVSIQEAHNYAYPRVVASQPDSQPQLYDGYNSELIP